MVHVVPAFVDPDFCRRCRAAMDRGVPEEAEVLAAGFEAQPEVRSTTHLDVDPAVLDAVERRLDACREAVGQVFGLPLTGREGAGFLRYRPGGFYLPHRDWADDSPWPDAARRRVAVVLFLNGSRRGDPKAGEFEGGTLRLFPEAPGQPPVAVEPRAGTLVAFRADTLHEVTVVERGTRDAVVDWYY
jgi:SM-20-related protein